MAATTATSEIIVANRLTDGVVVFLDPSGAWVDTPEQAAIAAAAEDRAHLEALAAQGLASQTIAGWEFTEVALLAGTPEIVKNKQRIQALGPTVRPDLGKQAQNAA